MNYVGPTLSKECTSFLRWQIIARQTKRNTVTKFNLRLYYAYFLEINWHLC